MAWQGAIVPTPDELRRLADELESRAAELRRAADEVDAKMRAALLESEGLDGTVMRTMTAADAGLNGEERRRLGIAKARGSKHPFPRALYRAGTTVSALAEAHGLDRNIVKSWFAKGTAARPIPRKFANEIERAYGIQPTSAAWPRGLKD